MAAAPRLGDSERVREDIEGGVGAAGSGDRGADAPATSKARLPGGR
jgi:hypothetical protein